MSVTGSLGQLLPTVFNASTVLWLGGSFAILAMVLALAPGAFRRFDPGPLVAMGYLAAILSMFTGLRLFGGGPGSSMARFTDFINPVAIGLGVLILSSVWRLDLRPAARGMLTAATLGVAGGSMYLGVPLMLSQHWHESARFLVGRDTYATINDPLWDTATAFRLARSIPADNKAEMVNFLPGFTSVPATPFQRPDGCAYIRDYTRVLSGSEREVADIYAAAKINYFLFDVSNQSDLVWSGFSALFAPDSVRSRMRLVSHEQSSRHDLYLLTWNGDHVAPGGPPFEEFLQKWGDKLADARHRRSDTR